MKFYASVICRDIFILSVTATVPVCARRSAFIWLHTWVFRWLLWSLESRATEAALPRSAVSRRTPFMLDSGFTSRVTEFSFFGRTSNFTGTFPTSSMYLCTMSCRFGSEGEDGSTAASFAVCELIRSLAGPLVHTLGRRNTTGC